MKYIMYQGETFETSVASDGVCNAKDGEVVEGFLLVNVFDGHFIFTPAIDYGDPDFKNALQHFYSYKVKPESVKKIKSTRNIDDFAMEQYRKGGE